MNKVPDILGICVVFFVAKDRKVSRTYRGLINCFIIKKISRLYHLENRDNT